MDAAAGGTMLTVCLTVGGFLIRLAIRADAAERRRHPYRPQPPRAPKPPPRDPALRTGAEIRELSTRTPSSNTEPRDRVPPQPQDARPEPRPHQPGVRSAAEMRDLLAREPWPPEG